MPIDPGTVGSSTGPHPVRWTAKDAALYALAVGAGADDALDELEFTTDNTEGKPQRVLPTFPLVISSGQPPLPVGTFERSQSVHGEQGLTLHAELPPAGEGTIVSQIGAIYDKGSGALVQRISTLFGQDGGKLASYRTGQFIRGEGGFGGERGPPSTWRLPDRAPDYVVEQATRPDQAVIYRLTGDTNPLHTDPALARRAGFKRPILHGLCTFGFVGRAILTLVDRDPARVRAMSTRFATPVIPGDRLTTEFWSDQGRLLFRTRVGERTVLDGGEAEID